MTARRRSRPPHVSFGTLVVSLAVSAAAWSQPAGSDAAQRLAGRALGATPFLDDTRELCDRIGGRPTGSPALDRAVEWSVAKLKAAGVDVHTEAYRVPILWLPGTAEAAVVTPETIPLRVVSCPFTPSTSGAMTARVVDAGHGTAEDFTRLGASARGAIALVRSEEMKTVDDLFGEYMKSGALLEAAGKAGVSALLLQGTHPRGLLDRHPMTFDGSLTKTPVVMMSREHAARLARLLAAGEVSVRLSVVNRTGPAYEARNVIGEIRGREKPDEVVLLGAHLDSWDLGTGANDNGVNVALVLDVARGMKALGLAPRRTVRFVLFTGEENGMLGSAAYVRSHASEMDRYAAVVVFDIGSGRTTGFFLNGREELRGPVDAALTAASGFAASQHVVDAVDGTDNFDFLLSGVPNVVANQDWGPYIPDYHAESDVFDHVDGREAKVNVAIASALVWGLAEAPERPAKRQTRAEVEKLLVDTKLVDQMKAFAQWDDWKAGRRGASR